MTVKKTKRRLNPHSQEIASSVTSRILHIDEMTRFVTESMTRTCARGNRTIQHSTGQDRTVQYSSVQYSKVQYIKVQYSTVQYSKVQCSTVQNNTGRNCVEHCAA